MNQVQIKDLKCLNLDLNSIQTISIIGGIRTFDEYLSTCRNLMSTGPTSLACGEFVRRNRLLFTMINSLNSGYPATTSTVK